MRNLTRPARHRDDVISGRSGPAPAASLSLANLPATFTIRSHHQRHAGVDLLRPSAEKLFAP
ncbi:hypothetical protein KCP73_10985 [Salmonella enterica subsp. enterica]|nr:hypothetical protein KCP73_10985 [Salmonella enterica subsp. enterica]